MIIKTTILTLFFLTFSFAYGQNPKVRKETKITTTFDYTYIIDGKLYLSKKGEITQDTLITEFNQDGTIEHSSNKQYVIFSKYVEIDSIVLIKEINNLKHEREFWSDTTSVDVYTQNFGDSIFQTKISQNDTLQINISYFTEGTIVKCHNRDFRPGYSKFNEIILYDTKTENREIATVITTYFQNGLTDTIRIDNNNKRDVYKTLEFNNEKKEWFEKETIRWKKRKRIVKETFYHNYHKKYFTTKSTTKYNKQGYPISMIKYDTYLRHIESISVYKHEFY
jgi:hypothetical protein